MGSERQDSNQITRDYFDSLMIEMRHIDSEIPDTRIRLFGEEFSMPVATAALSHLNGTAPDGMRGLSSVNNLLAVYALECAAHAEDAARLVRDGGVGLGAALVDAKNGSHPSHPRRWNCGRYSLFDSSSSGTSASTSSYSRTSGWASSAHFIFVTLPSTAASTASCS